MNSKYTVPEFSKDDVLFIYTIQHFTGFAPCLDNEMYSLACCMGNKKNGGMRATACKSFKKAQTEEKHVWILSIAGGNLSKDNSSEIDYQPGDMVYLARVDKIRTWPEYSRQYNDRNDAIYTDFDFINRTAVIRPNSQHNEKNINTDCALCSKNPENMKQIILSEHFYIFTSGVQLPSSPNLIHEGRPYSYKNNQIEDLRKGIDWEKAIYCYNTNIFKDVRTEKGQCGK